MEKKEISELIDILSEYGYDMLVKDNIITLLKDGYVKTIPLDNTLKLLKDEFFPIPINDVADMILSKLSQHDVSSRRELLKAFKEWERWYYKKPYDTDSDEIINDYLSL